MLAYGMSYFPAAVSRSRYRVPKVLLTHCVVAVAILLAHNDGYCDETVQEQEVQTLQFETSLNPVLGKRQSNADIGSINNFRTTVYCGALKPGRRYRIELRLLNPTPKDFETGEVKASCSCMAIEQSDRTLPAGGNLDISFTAETSSKSKRPDSSWRLDIFGKEEQRFVIAVSFEYSIAGLMQFPNPKAVLEIDSSIEHSVFTIPMVATSPVNPEFVEVLLPDEFDGVTATVKRDPNNQDRANLLLKVENRKIPVSGLSGLVQCIDPSTGREAELYCVMDQFVPVRVAPTFLRVAISNDDEKEYYASAIVTSYSEKDSPSDSKNESRLMIEAHVDGIPLRVTKQYLSASIVRVKVFFSAATLAKFRELPDTERRISWVVRCERGVFRTSSLVGSF